MDWNSSTVEEKISFNFKNPDLLFLSLTHPSYAKQIDQPENDNERLEYLGDNLLNFIIVDYLYHHFPYLTISKFTALRDKLSEGERLTKLWFNLGLGESYPFIVTKEERHRLRVKNSNPFEKTLKALVGAIHIDRGFSQAYNWINKQLIAPLLERHQKDSKERISPEKQVKLLGDTLFSAIIIDYLYDLLPYVNPGRLSKLAKTLMTKEKQAKYISKISPEDWEIITARNEKTSKTSFPTLLGTIYLHFEQKNHRTRYQNTQKWLIENCLDQEELLQETITLLLKDGVPQKWIVNEILGYKGKNYDQGRKRFHELMDQSGEIKIDAEEE
ncbi:ribonuclease III domain-containing protein [Crocosphaera sp. XPORK-15E]|uniref:ribonuclease III domain-containing protein n=1 Tax=Crocosphaera sp. XPORK-15E TaxID=3110247 RepID=UPI002B200BB2|nr:ribonuclease III domain-containing protein [Crocosphaera sp. XPORK-15E]MEA5535452.1 ribonuclease III domain-containing protein [Crocosphaera sp. XPORK-15E]